MANKSFGICQDSSGELLGPGKSSKSTFFFLIKVKFLWNFKPGSNFPILQSLEP